MATKLTEVFTALKAKITSVSPANGQSYALPADHVYRPDQTALINSKKAQDYPKIMFLLDKGSLEKQVSRRVLRTVRYGVTTILLEGQPLLPNKQPDPNFRPIADVVRDLCGDLEDIALDDSDLGGLVHEIAPDGYETDSGMSYPEGVIVIWYNISWYEDR